MSLDLLAVQDEIVAKLRELPQSVYETSAPDDSKLKFGSNGMMLPYIVVEFSDMSPAVNGSGIVSSRYDVNVASMIVVCVGPTERSSRQLANAVRNHITGYIPNDAGEIKISGGGIDYTTQEGKVQRYISEIGFTFLVNTVW